MKRVRVGRARLLSVPWLALLGCAASGTDGGGSEDETGTPGTFTPAPTFLEPDDGVVRVDADALDPIELRVRQVTPGSTQLFVDGNNLGVLAAGSPEGEIRDDRVVLHLQGALEAGSHTLSMFTPGVPNGAASATITVDVRPVAQPESALSISFDPVPLAAAESIGTSGQLGDGLLWWTTGDQISAARTDPSGRWLTDEFHRVSATDAGTLAPGRAALVHDVERALVRSAWLTGGGVTGPAVTVRWAESAWGVSATDDDAAFDGTVLGGGTEWSELSALRLEGESVFAIAHAPADTESAAPGDWRMVHARWTDERGPTQAAAMVVSGGHDVEGPGPLVDALLSKDAPRVMVRSGGAWPVAVVASTSNGFASLADPEAPRPSTQAGVLISVAAVGGALGSRVGLTATDAGVFTYSTALWADRLSEPDLPAAFPAAGAARVRGPIAVASLGGRPIFGLPFGPDARAWVLVFGGAKFRGIDVGRHCDQIAFAAGAGDLLDLDTFTLPVACLDDGMLHIGSVARVA